VRERAPRRARTRSGRVPRTLAAVLAAAVLATLGLFGTSYSAPVADVAETGTATGLLSTSEAPWEMVSSPTGVERPAPGTDVSAPEMSADAEPNPPGVDLDPPAEGQALVALALFVLVLWGAGRRRRAVADAPSGAYIGAVDHVPRTGLEAQLCPDAHVPAGAAGVRRARQASSVLVGPLPMRILDRTALVPCGLFARPRAPGATPVDARSRTPAGRTACAGASPDCLPRAVSRSAPRSALAT
jgi:hypothetical protein